MFRIVSIAAVAAASLSACADMPVNGHAPTMHGIFPAEESETGTLYVRGAEYEAGVYGPVNYELAMRNYADAARHGDVRAMHAIGMMHAEGRGRPTSYSEAARWFGEAAARDNSKSRYNLGQMYETGIFGASEGRPNYRKAAEFYYGAAEQGNPMAQASLGAMYAEGRGVAVDLGEAVRLLRRAAEKGEPRAMSYLADMYDAGRGVPQDSGEAARWRSLIGSPAFSDGIRATLVDETLVASLKERARVGAEIGTMRPSENPADQYEMGLK